MAGKKQPDLIAAAFELIARDGWRALTMSGLAAHAGLSLDKVYAALPGKAHILHQFADRMDAATFGLAPAEIGELTAKERLFELLMRRLDALKPYKPAFREVARRRELDGCALLSLACRMDRLAERLLDACEAPFRGPRRRIARRLLMAAYARVFAVWLGDDTDDLAQTMAELDKRLGQMETLARLADPLRGRRRQQTAQPAAA